MAAPIQEIETLSPNEAIACLWNQKAADRCKIGLSDVVRISLVPQYANPALMAIFEML